MPPLPIDRYAADLRLCKRALRGDGPARREFVQRMSCIPPMVRSLEGRFGRLLREEEREEVVQNALTAVWRKLDDFSGASKLETWAYGFCLNELRKWRERTYRASRFRSDDEIAGAPTSMVWDPEPVETEYVHTSLEKLGRPAATVIRLKHFEELTFEQIGEALDLSPNTAKTIYYRGLQKLRDSLRPHWEREQA